MKLIPTPHPQNNQGWGGIQAVLVTACPILAQPWLEASCFLATS